jgi:hypothetical protein
MRLCCPLATLTIFVGLTAQHGLQWLYQGTMIPILIRMGIVSGTKTLLPFCLATFCGDVNLNYSISNQKNKQTRWPESESELYRPSDRRLSAKLVPTFADRGVSRSQRAESPMAVISIF